MTKKPLHNTIERPPVVAVMGHIDHGKSTLLDFVRQSNITGGEFGGITQHIGAYEVSHELKDGSKKRITFLDTPGHEAFTAIRRRGAKVADIAILVVAADDGVKPQTTEALKCIKDAGIPYVVAINKIDKQGATVDRAVQSLAEAEIYLEGMGGAVPYAPISAKTGQGVPELLDLILLLAEMEELKSDTGESAEGVVIESDLDAKKGISATIIIKKGTLKKGDFVTAGASCAPVRILEDWSGSPISSATFSSPVRVLGWSAMPEVGAVFKTFENKKDAELCLEEVKRQRASGLAGTDRSPENSAEMGNQKAILPLVVKADVVGSLEAVKYEISKLKHDRIEARVISAGIGTIGEADIKSAGTDPNTVVIGFNVKTDNQAEALALRLGIQVETFTVIYKLSEKLQELMLQNAPKVEVEEATGVAKVLKCFSQTKDKQVIGGKVEEGSLSRGDKVKIIRRENEVGVGVIRELQKQKLKIGTVEEGSEFGSQVESKTDIASGDRLRAFKIVKK